MIGLVVITSLIIIPSRVFAQHEADHVLRVNTRLVLVDVIVRTRGASTPELGKDDFLLYEDGRPREIALIESPARENDGDIVTTTSEAADRTTGATVILFDQFNADATTQSKAKDQIQRFLRDSGPPGMLAIYALTRDGLQVLHDYTEDRDALRDVVSDLRPTEPVEMSLTGVAGLTGRFGATDNEVGLDSLLAERRETYRAEFGVRQLSRQAARHFLDRRVRTTATALKSIAEELEGVLGPKNLLWLSGSFPFSFEENYFDASSEIWNAAITDLSRAGEALIRSRVAIHPIDARGLFVLNPSGTETMAAIAAVTGGKAAVNTNGIALAMRNAMEDTLNRYILGFYPSSGGLDADFHNLTVEVLRDGVEISYRSGYYGFGVRELTLAERRRELRSLILSPLHATGIDLAAHEYISDDGRGAEATAVTVNLRDIDLRLRNDIWVGEIDVAWVSVDERSDETAIHYNTAAVEISDSDYDNALQEGVVVFKHLHEPTRRFIRVVVVDWRSGKKGSIAFVAGAGG